MGETPEISPTTWNKSSQNGGSLWEGCALFRGTVYFYHISSVIVDSRSQKVAEKNLAKVLIMVEGEWRAHETFGLRPMTHCPCFCECLDHSKDLDRSFWRTSQSLAHSGWQREVKSVDPNKTWLDRGQGSSGRLPSRVTPCWKVINSANQLFRGTCPTVHGSEISLHTALVIPINTLVT